MDPSVYILIVNWNKWEETVECLESVFRSLYPRYRVIVCDNGSGDGSLDRIKGWADGGIDATTGPNNILRRLSFPPVDKPIPWVEYNRAEAEAGGRRDDRASRLILIDTGANLGYGGGNNVGFRYGLARGDFHYFWVLNNDTAVEPDALTKLIERMRERPDAGLCGSTLLYYQCPGTAQAFGGGTYSKWLGTTRTVGAYLQASTPPDPGLVESRLDYIAGSSCLVSKDFLEDIGLLDESYFMYFEEVDWAVRARGRYGLAYAPESVVYHRTGAASRDEVPRPADKPILLDYYINRNRLVFSRRYYPLLLPMVYFSSAGIIFNRIKRRQWRRALMVLNILLGRCNNWPSTPEQVLERLNRL